MTSYKEQHMKHWNGVLDFTGIEQEMANGKVSVQTGVNSIWMYLSDFEEVIDDPTFSRLRSAIRLAETIDEYDDWKNSLYDWADWAGYWIEPAGM